MNLHHRLIVGILFISLVVGFGRASYAAANAKTDKTLVAWVTLDDLDQRGGSVLTIQVGENFDGVVFGERQAGKWMAGSAFFRRTEQDQNKNPVEKADPKTLVQIAIVYQGDEITIYRNGEQFAAYRAKTVDLLSSEANLAVFGLRHLGGNGSFRGSIDDARIYAQALTPEEIKALRPNHPSAIKPYAWWDFEGEVVKDRAGRFTHSSLAGGAKLAGGRLVLGDKAVAVAAMTEELAAAAGRPNVPPGPYVEETPAVPEPLPDDWLTFHLAHPGPGRGHPGDPNCAFYYKGRYHLHYIYRNRWGFAFAHVSSKDMVTWQWHPTKLVPPFTGHGMFSGTGFFTKEGRPAIIYHGEGSARNQLAFARDDQLNEWTKPEPLTVKTTTGEEARIRHWDPDCWLDGDAYYAISGGAPPLLMKSSDLKQWLYLGELLHGDMPASLGVDRKEDVSCPNMFKIGDKWMLLCISHRLGCRYYLGDFKDGKYLPDSHAMMNWARRDVFAPESLVTPDGRRVMWAWCLVPGTQTAIQSLPRALSLPKDGVLRIRPLQELETLRYDEQEERDIAIPADSQRPLKLGAGDAVELSVSIKPTTAREFGVSVFGDTTGNGFAISYLPDKKVLTLGDIKPSLELKEGEALNLRIFLDKGLVEVFANDRQAAVFMRAHDKEKAGISLFSKGGSISATVNRWKLKSIYSRARQEPLGTR